MTEQSRHLLDCHIAGFAYWDGVEVIGDLKLGTELTLMAEPDNQYDPEAIAVYYKDKKLGYVPREKNGLISKFLYFGYSSFFEVHVNRVTPDAYPEKQVGVVVKLKDMRNGFISNQGAVV